MKLFGLAKPTFTLLCSSPIVEVPCNPLGRQEIKAEVARFSLLLRLSLHLKVLTIPARCVGRRLLVFVPSFVSSSFDPNFALFVFVSAVQLDKNVVG